MNKQKECIRHQERTKLNPLSVCKLVLWTMHPSASKGRLPPPIRNSSMPDACWSPVKYQRATMEAGALSPVMEAQKVTLGNNQIRREVKRERGRKGERNRGILHCYLWHDIGPRWPTTYLLPSYEWWSPENSYPPLFPGVEFASLLLLICTVETMLLVCFPQRYRAKGRTRRGEQGTRVGERRAVWIQTSPRSDK